MTSRHARRLLFSLLSSSRKCNVCVNEQTGFRQLLAYENRSGSFLRHTSPTAASPSPGSDYLKCSAFSFALVRKFSWWSRGNVSHPGADSRTGSRSNEIQESAEILRTAPNSHSDQRENLVEIHPLTSGDSEQSYTRSWTLGGDELTVDQVGQSSGAGAIDGQIIAITTNEVAGLWKILRLPADGVVALVDGVHGLTGAPWWLTIIGSTLAFRATLFPFTVYYIKKSAQFAASISVLPPIRPPKDSGNSFVEQYQIFTKRRLELGVPSPFWAAAGLLQAPLFLYWIIALRGMAMAPYPGFDSGGALWFVDLTVPVHGALGSLFPSLMALTYFINIQVSFRVVKPSNEITAFFMKIYQWWLEAVTVPLFVMGFYLPQGVFMYWLTNNCCNLAQSIALQNDGFRKNFGLPLLSELEKLRFKREEQIKDTDSKESLNVDGLLLSATECVAAGRDEEAIKLLEFARKRFPDEPETYNVYGMLHIKKQQWSEALEYYSFVLSKAEDDEPRITAYMGAGIALYNQGRRREAVDAMRPLVYLSVPKDPAGRQKYLRALVTLSSALSQEGLKDEALSVLEIAAKWDSSVNVYIEELKKMIDQ